MKAKKFLVSDFWAVAHPFALDEGRQRFSETRRVKVFLHSVKKSYTNFHYFILVSRMFKQEIGIFSMISKFEKRECPLRILN